MVMPEQFWKSAIYLCLHSPFALAVFARLSRGRLPPNKEQFSSDLAPVTSTNFAGRRLLRLWYKMWWQSLRLLIRQSFLPWEICPLAKTGFGTQGAGDTRKERRRSHGMPRQLMSCNCWSACAIVARCSDDNNHSRLLMGVQ